MGLRLGTIVYVLAMVVIIVGVDVAFLRHAFWPRLGVNVGIVVVFLLGYLLLFRHVLR